MPPKSIPKEAVQKTAAGEEGSSAITVHDIENVAFNSVHGFLTNIAKGVRRPQAEGGKGTRRRVEMYISTDLSTAGAKTEEPVAKREADVDADNISNFESFFSGDTEELGGNVEDGLDDFNCDDWEEFDMDGGAESIATKPETPTAAASPQSEQQIKPQQQHAKTEQLEAFQNSGFIPPPPPNVGAASRDPAYEQMLVDREVAVARARQARLTVLKRTVNKVMACLLRAKLLDRVTTRVGQRLRSAALPTTASAQHTEGGSWESLVCSTRKELEPILSLLLNQQTSAAANAFGVKPTHAPLWLSTESATAVGVASNPFLRAVASVLARLAKDPLFGLSSFDVGAWGKRFLKDSHSVPPEAYDDEVCFRNLTMEKESSEQSQRVTVGSKRQREADCDEEGEEEKKMASGSDGSRYVHPAQYNLAVLSLFKAIGIPSRLVVAVENPAPPASETAALAIDNVDDGSGAAVEVNEGGPHHGGDGEHSGSYLHVIEQLKQNVKSVKSAANDGAKKSSAKKQPSSTSPSSHDNSAANGSVTPCSHYWIEVWDPLRQAVVSVNPIHGLTTRFGAPYAFALYSHCGPFLQGEEKRTSGADGGDLCIDSEAIVDVTPRYVPKYSAVYGRRVDKLCHAYRRLLWPLHFHAIKDYAEDRSYTVTRHLIRMANELLDGSYTIADNADNNASSEHQQRATTKAATVTVSDARLRGLCDQMEEEDETNALPFAFGASPIAEVSADDGAVASDQPHQRVADANNFSTVATAHQTLLQATGSSSDSSPLWLPSFAAREQTQLDKLLYAEPSPTTFAEAKGHPLYVLEKDLQRHEAIYPKDKTTMVGTIRGVFVYRRTAVVALRSRDGWLREGRSLISEDTQPYRVVPPPPSRPLAPASKFYGFWQTRPFEPLPVSEKGGLPRHGNTNWYMVLGAPIPATLALVTAPLGPSVARRTNIEYRQAIARFVKKEWNGGGDWGKGGAGYGGYEAKAEGIVIRRSDYDKFITALGEYERLLAAQEAKRRAIRVSNWWNAFAQRLLANERMRLLFQSGNAHQ